MRKVYRMLSLALCSGLLLGALYASSARLVRGHMDPSPTLLAPIQMDSVSEPTRIDWMELKGCTKELDQLAKTTREKLRREATKLEVENSRIREAARAFHAMAQERAKLVRQLEQDLVQTSSQELVDKRSKEASDALARVQLFARILEVLMHTYRANLVRIGELYTEANTAISCS